MGLTAEDLQYFKDLIEGREVPSWHPWWRANEKRLRAELCRADFLRLKFGNLPCMAEILSQQGIDFQWTPKGRREAAYARLHPSAVDERGHPLPEFRKRAYDGALELFRQGDAAAGQKQLEKALKKIRRMRDEIERGESLAEMQMDAEQLYAEGDAAAGLALLRAVARWQTDSDLESPAVEYARAALRALGETWEETPSLLQ